MQKDEPTAVPKKPSLLVENGRIRRRLWEHRYFRAISAPTDANLDQGRQWYETKPLVKFLSIFHTCEAHAITDLCELVPTKSHGYKLLSLNFCAIHFINEYYVWNGGEKTSLQLFLHQFGRNGKSLHENCCSFISIQDQTNLLFPAPQYQPF